MREHLGCLSAVFRSHSIRLLKAPCQANVLLRRASSRFSTSSFVMLTSANSCCRISASTAYRTIPCNMVDRTCASCELRRTSPSSAHCIGSLVGHIALAPAACHAVSASAMELHLLHLLCSSCLCIQGYDRQVSRDFVDNLDPATALQSSLPAACLPVLSIVMQFWSNSNFYHEVLAVGYYINAGLFGITSGPLTEMCMTESQVSALFSNLLLWAVPAMRKVSNRKNQFSSNFVVPKKGRPQV